MEKRIQVTRSSLPPFEEYINEIRELWDSRMLSNRGVKHRELEERLKEYLGVENVSLCSNGHLALEGVLDALDVKGEVITTPFTFASTTNALVRKGIKPVFCDIKSEDFTLDPEKLEPLISEKCSAVLAVHVYGNLCEDKKISRLARKYGLKLIYDAAHAFGVTKNGVSAAAMGDASMFSFHPTKVFHTAEGGAAVFKSRVAFEKFELLKNFGLKGEELALAGGNAKMNEFSAAMGLCNLRGLGKSVEARKKAALRYFERLEKLDGLRLNKPVCGVASNYAYFPVVVEPDVFGLSRDALVKTLDKNGVGARKYFYPLTSSLKALGKTAGEIKSETPVAAEISENVLCLPLYEGLSKEDVDRVCDIVVSAKKA